jgi:hypothetical protein
MDKDFYRKQPGYSTNEDWKLPKEDAAFLDGFDAGWDETGEDHNGEWSRTSDKDGDTDWYQIARAKALHDHKAGHNRFRTGADVKVALTTDSLTMQEHADLVIDPGSGVVVKNRLAQ